MISGGMTPKYNFQNIYLWYTNDSSTEDGDRSADCGSDSKESKLLENTPTV